MWKQLGVQAELVNREVKVHYDELKQNKFDIARAAWVADYNDPQNFLYLLETRTGVAELRPLQQSRVRRADDGAGPGRATRRPRLDIMQQAESIAMTRMPGSRSTTTCRRPWSRRRSQGYVDNTKQIHRSRWVSLKE